MAASDELARLHQIKHLVVLMMENRSFDHMLGYLSRDGMPDVNGLSGTETLPDDRGQECPVFELAEDQTAFHLPGQPFGKELDPCHSPECVQQQLEDGNRGFLRNFIAKKNPPAEYREIVIGHYTAKHLPVYDHLARQFCVCDAWHASIPGDTWPNRLYSLTGGAAEPVGLRLGPLERLAARLKGQAFIDQLRGAPIYELEAFTRYLGDEQWRWYSHDPATLRAADKLYRSFLDRHQHNFAFVDRKRVRLLTEAAEWLIAGDSFLDDAAKGELRDLSWIDPNFIDFRIWDPNSSDDHPPSDIRAGQALVLDLYEALVRSPGWEDTVLIITYDEHGGFFDHVPPPAVDDDSGFPTLGVRVPALVVGPRVKNFVCHQTFDHTSLIKTILLRFAAKAEEAIEKMGPRVQAAPHLGQVLEDAPRSDLADHDHLHDQLACWREEARDERRAQPSAPSQAGDGAGQEMILHDFQEDFLRFALAMRKTGLPPGHP
jgi:phospholipase C